MSTTDFIPDFIYKSTVGEISNIKSRIKQYKQYHLISYDKSVNIWSLQTQVMRKSFRSKKYTVTCFTIHEDWLLIGFSNGQVQVFSLLEGYDKITEYKIHAKRIVDLACQDKIIYTAACDGLLAKYDMYSEVPSKLASLASIDCFCISDNTILVGCADSTFTVLTNIKSAHDHATIEQCKNDFESTEDMNKKTRSRIVAVASRLKYIYILDKSSYLLIYRNNDIKIYNLDDDTVHDVMTLKKIKMAKYFEMSLYILTDNGIYTYVISKTKKSYNITKKTRTDVARNIVDFIINGAVITRDNSYLNNKHVVSYHAHDIISVTSDDGRICTFSNDKVMIWNVENTSLQLYNTINVTEGKSFCVYKSWYVVGCEKAVSFYDKRSLKLCKTIEIAEKEKYNVCVESVCNFECDNDKQVLRGKKAVKVHLRDSTKNKGKDEEQPFDIDTLVIAINKTVYFYKQDLEVFDQIDLQEYISCIKVCKQLLLVSLINSKVYIYNNKKELTKTLYGHSLPVVNAVVRQDFVYTIGLDKMLKIWGADFGDCRKSIIVNEGKNIEVISKDVFVIGTGHLKWYNRNKLYHEKKSIECNLLHLTDNHLLCVWKNTISLYEIDKYELDKTDDTEDDIDLIETKFDNVVHLSKYEEFLNSLEEKIDTKTTHTQDKFNRIIDTVGLNELDAFIALLNVDQIERLLQYLSCTNNKIVCSRILYALAVSHKDIICHNATFKSIKKHLLHDLNILRNRLGVQLYKILLKQGTYNKL